MNVLINAISINQGGGLVVLKNLLNEMNKLNPNINWYITAEKKILSLLPVEKNIKGLSYNWPKKTPLHHLCWYEFILPKLIKEYHINVCFSQTNFLPHRALKCATLLLVQHAGYFSDKFQEAYFQWYKGNFKKLIWQLKKNWVISSMHKANLITVQTETLAQQIYKKINKKNFLIVPHGIGLLSSSKMDPKKFPTEKIWRIGYITKFGVQKDFATACEAIFLLNKLGIQTKLVLTLNPLDPEFSTISTFFKKYGIVNQIENHGEIANFDDILKIYHSLHLFIFPSWCESFGFTLIEAMSTGLPVVAADSSSNKEIVANDNFLFTSENSGSLVTKLKKLMNEPELYLAASQHSLSRSQAFNWQYASRQLLTAISHLANS